MYQHAARAHRRHYLFYPKQLIIARENATASHRRTPSTSEDSASWSALALRHGACVIFDATYCMIRVVALPVNHHIYTDQCVPVKTFVVGDSRFFSTCFVSAWHHVVINNLCVEIYRRFPRYVARAMQAT